MMSLCSFIPTRCNNSMARRFFQPNHCHHLPLKVQFGIFWINCLPIFRLGSRQERGSWKIIDISLPTNFRRLLGLSFSNSTS